MFFAVEKQLYLVNDEHSIIHEGLAFRRVKTAVGNRGDAYDIMTGKFFKELGHRGIESVEITLLAVGSPDRFYVEFFVGDLGGDIERAAGFLDQGIGAFDSCQ